MLNIVICKQIIGGQIGPELLYRYDGPLDARNQMDSTRRPHKSTVAPYTRYTMVVTTHSTCFRIAAPAHLSAQLPVVAAALGSDGRRVHEFGRPPAAAASGKYSSAARHSGHGALQP
jgi:hypothetical protein